MIRHLSLDFWNTLASPNPEFGKARLAFMAEYLHLPEGQVKEAYRFVKTASDTAAERFGSACTCDEIYGRLLSQVGSPDADGIVLRNGLDALFQEHPPIVLRQNIEALLALQSKGVLLSIASNTNFISGSVLDAIVLSTWGVTWAFQVFSDQVGMSKPNPGFWGTVAKKTWCSGGLRDATWHVGDNLICDGSCRIAGIRFLRVGSPADLALVLENTFR